MRRNLEELLKKTPTVPDLIERCEQQNNAFFNILRDLKGYLETELLVLFEGSRFFELMDIVRKFISTSFIQFLMILTFQLNNLILGFPGQKLKKKYIFGKKEEFKKKRSTKSSKSVHLGTLNLNDDHGSDFNRKGFQNLPNK